MSYRFFHRGRERDAGEEVWRAEEVRSAWPIIVKLSWVLAAVMLLLAADLHAQTSTVIGTIRYRSNQPAASVYVSIGGRYRYTDVSGRYKMDGVPQGRQRMIIKRGTRILWQGDVNISGPIVTLDRVLP